MRHLKPTSPDNEELLLGVRLSLCMWQESPIYRQMEPDIDKLIEEAYIAREDPNRFVNVVMYDNTCCGFMMGAMAPIAFIDGWYAFERMLYVSPEKRGSVAASLLVGAFEQWARDRDALYILLGTTTGVRPERTERFYNKMGYNTVGVLTMKEL